MKINDSHAYGEEDHDSPSLGIHKGKTIDTVVWVVPVGIVGSWGNPANPPGAIIKLQPKSCKACSETS
jgi:hypothetical protein